MDASAQPFLPLVFLGIALRPVPPAVVRALVRPVLRRLALGLVSQGGDRLSGMAGSVAVVPTDLPYGVCLHIADGALDIALVEAADGAPGADAVVRAPALVLIDLARGEGRDGDARFFSRDLRMEGDTGLVMALRYALEEAGGPALPVPDGLRVPLARLARRAVADTERIQDAVVAPMARWQARTDARLADLEQRVSQRSAPRRSRPATATPVPLDSGAVR